RRSLPSDLIRRWVPVRRQEHAPTRTGQIAVFPARAKCAQWRSLTSRPAAAPAPGHAMTRAGLATLLCLTLVAAAPARAEDAADFFRGKTVRIIVGVGVGSGYDLNARLLARFLPRYIPGHPTVIVQNQPGAGSLTMTNQLYIAGPFDGSAIGASFN